MRHNKSDAPVPVVVGVDQRTLPVALRETLAIAQEELPAALAAVRAIAPEAMILSTCNRVEIIAVAPPARVAGLQAFLVRSRPLSPSSLEMGNDGMERGDDVQPYALMGEAAVRHVLRLAAGLESMVLGEDQIVAQIKEAYQHAHVAGMAGATLHRLAHQALATAKRVRSHTFIATHHVSVVSTGVDLVARDLGSLAHRRIVIVGAGRMAALACKLVQSYGGRDLAIVNRTLARADALAATFGGHALPLEDLPALLAEADLVLTCLDVPAPIITPAMITHPCILLDLSVPRAVAADVRAAPGARLVDLDALEAICAANRAARGHEIAHADALIDHDVAAFQEWLASRRAVPAIRAMRDRAEAIRAAEVRRALARLPALSAEDRAAVEALSAALVKKLLHAPTVAMRDPAIGSQVARTVRAIHDLSHEE